MQSIDLPGSGKSLTSLMPCSMSSNLPFRARSRRLTMLGLSSPLVADFFASSRSFALAAKMSSRAAARASCMASRAVFLALVERVAKRREESFAMRAASEGEALVNDIFVRLHTAPLRRDQTLSSLKAWCRR